MLNANQIEQFRMLWKNRFGQEISKEKALKEGLRLVNLIKTICCPDDKQNQKGNNY
ncbi:MAG: hypothetical protein ACTSUT_16145 [Promethearchaeota archaeon]